MPFRDPGDGGPRRLPPKVYVAPTPPPPPIAVYTPPRPPSYINPGAGYRPPINVYTPPKPPAAINVRPQPRTQPKPVQPVQQRPVQVYTPPKPPAAINAQAPPRPMPKPIVQQPPMMGGVAPVHAAPGAPPAAGAPPSAPMDAHERAPERMPAPVYQTRTPGMVYQAPKPSYLNMQGGSHVPAPQPFIGPRPVPGANGMNRVRQQPMQYPANQDNGNGHSTSSFVPPPMPANLTPAQQDQWRTVVAGRERIAQQPRETLSSLADHATRVLGQDYSLLRQAPGIKQVADVYSAAQNKIADYEDAASRRLTGNTVLENLARADDALGRISRTGPLAPLFRATVGPQGTIDQFDRVRKNPFNASGFNQLARDTISDPVNLATFGAGLAREAPAAAKAAVGRVREANAAVPELLGIRPEFGMANYTDPFGRPVNRMKVKVTGEKPAPIPEPARPVEPPVAARPTEPAVPRATETTPATPHIPTRDEDVARIEALRSHASVQQQAGRALPEDVAAARNAEVMVREGWLTYDQAFKGLQTGDIHADLHPDRLRETANAVALRDYQTRFGGGFDVTGEPIRGPQMLNPRQQQMAANLIHKGERAGLRDLPTLDDFNAGTRAEANKLLDDLKAHVEQGKPMPPRPAAPQPAPGIHPDTVGMTNDATQYSIHGENLSAPKEAVPPEFQAYVDGKADGPTPKAPAAVPPVETPPLVTPRRALPHTPGYFVDTSGPVPVESLPNLTVPQMVPPPAPPSLTPLNKYIADARANPNTIYKPPLAGGGGRRIVPPVGGLPAAPAAGGSGKLPPWIKTAAKVALGGGAATIAGWTALNGLNNAGDYEAYVNSGQGKALQAATGLTPPPDFYQRSLQYAHLWGAVPVDRTIATMRAWDQYMDEIGVPQGAARDKAFVDFKQAREDAAVIKPDSKASPAQKQAAIARLVDLQSRYSPEILSHISTDFGKDLNAILTANIARGPDGQPLTPEQQAPKITDPPRPGDSPTRLIDGKWSGWDGTKWVPNEKEKPKPDTQIVGQMNDLVAQVNAKEIDPRTKAKAEKQLIDLAKQHPIEGDLVESYGHKVSEYAGRQAPVIISDPAYSDALEAGRLSDDLKKKYDASPFDDPKRGTFAKTDTWNEYVQMDDTHKFWVRYLAERAARQGQDPAVTAAQLGANWAEVKAVTDGWVNSHGADSLIQYYDQAYQKPIFDGVSGKGSGTNALALPPDGGPSNPHLPPPPPGSAASGGAPSSGREKPRPAAAPAATPVAAGGPSSGRGRARPPVPAAAASGGGGGGSQWRPYVEGGYAGRKAVGGQLVDYYWSGGKLVPETALTNASAGRAGGGGASAPSSPWRPYSEGGYAGRKMVGGQLVDFYWGPGGKLVPETALTNASAGGGGYPRGGSFPRGGAAAGPAQDPMGAPTGNSLWRPNGPGGAWRFWNGTDWITPASFDGQQPGQASAPAARDPFAPPVGNESLWRPLGPNGQMVFWNGKNWIEPGGFGDTSGPSQQQRPGYAPPDSPKVAEGANWINLYFQSGYSPKVLDAAYQWAIRPENQEAANSIPASWTGMGDQAPSLLQMAQAATGTPLPPELQAALTQQGGKSYGGGGGGGGGYSRGGGGGGRPRIESFDQVKPQDANILVDAFQGQGDMAAAMKIATSYGMTLDQLMALWNAHPRQSLYPSAMSRLRV